MVLEKDQHFMVDPEAIRRIVSLAGIKKGEAVLEIGPGSGNLTEALSRTQGEITAVEIDRNLSKQLTKRLQSRKNVTIITGNGLDYIKKHTKLNKIVSNLPYAICEPLLQILFFLGFKKVVLTVPRKFFENLLIEDKSVLSFYCSAFLKVEKAFDVPRKAFQPEPKTDSVVITLTIKKETLLSSVLKRQTMFLKNSLRESLCEIRGLTRNQARMKITEYNLGSLLEKRIQDLTLEELVLIKNKIS
jgi:16S rRNA (adenine1518-N6/adenine1519-N6)-dimethyltransferase